MGRSRSARESCAEVGPLAVLADVALVPGLLVARRAGADGGWDGGFPMVACVCVCVLFEGTYVTLVEGGNQRECFGSIHTHICIYMCVEVYIFWAFSRDLSPALIYQSLIWPCQLSTLR